MDSSNFREYSVATDVVSPDGPDKICILYLYCSMPEQLRATVLFRWGFYAGGRDPLASDY